MKRIIAFVTALAALSCTLTACGVNDESSSSAGAETSSTAEMKTADEDDTVTSAEDTSGNSVAASEKTTGTTMAFSTEPDDLNGHIVDDDAPYMDDLRKMIHCINDKDYVGYIEYMFPKKLLEPFIQAQGAESIEAFAEKMSQSMEAAENDEIFPIELGDVAEYDDSDELMKEIRKNVETARNMTDAEKYEQLTEQYGFDYNDMLDLFDDFRIIDVEMTAANGKKEVETFMTYYAEDEGWKFDVTMLSMLKYVKKSKQTSANSAAKSISVAANTAFLDIDEKSPKGFPNGNFVIGSESTYDTNVPDDISADDIRQKIKEYFDQADDYTYFIIVKNANAFKTVCVSRKDDKLVGMSPIDNDNTETFDELLVKAKAGGLYEEYKEAVSEKMKTSAE